MITFKQFISEAAEPVDYTDAGEVKAAIGTAKFNAMVKSEPFQSHRRMHFTDNTPTTYSVTDHGYHHKVEVSTFPYLTVFHIGQAKRGPARVTSYHHMVAHPEEPKRYVTIKTHGYDEE